MWIKILVIILLIGGLIMPHGQPDFGAYAQKETVFALSDMAELAARLGAIVTFDRRGDVVWLDDFEDNILKWDILTFGVGAGVTLSNLSARNGARSAELVTGAAIGDWALIRHFSPRPVLGKVGFELSFTTDNDLAAQFFYLIHYDGTNRHQACIWYNPTTNILYYYDAAGAPQQLAAGLDLTASLTMFHTLKLVVDLSTDKYVRLILNEVEYDLSSYSMQKSLNAALPSLTVQYTVRTGVAANQLIYADDAIITQNEP